MVSGAAGSVGALVCQLGKRAGAKVYGIAGSPEKCDWLVKELGVDGALNYKSPTFQDDFKKIGYLDVYFDNVGGAEMFRCIHKSHLDPLMDRRYPRLCAVATKQVCKNRTVWYASLAPVHKYPFTFSSQALSHNIVRYFVYKSLPRVPARFQMPPSRRACRIISL